MKPLFEHRVDKGLTQRRLAAAAGISVTTLMPVEKGQRSASATTMARISLALGVEVREVAEFNATLDKRLNHDA